MKVAYLLGSLNRGGTETLLLDVFRSASAAAFPFIGIHRNGGVLQADFAATTPALYCRKPHIFRWGAYLRNLRRLLLSEQVTIVHAQQSLDTVYAYLATRGTGIRVVQTFHGFDYDCSWLQRRLIGLSMRCSDAVCFVSDYQRQHYLKHYSALRATKTQVIYNGVDFARLDTTEMPNPSLPTQIDPASRGMKLGMVGNFVSVRSQNSLVQFLLRLHEKQVPYDFYFIGKRNEAEAWRYDDCVRFCEQNKLHEVHFLGSRGDVPQILHQLDAFIYATDHDTFGIAVVEAMAAGVPTFVNDYGVMKEITHQGEWATLYKTGDTEDLLAHFLSFCENQTTAKEQSRKTAATIRETYSMAAHLKQLNALYLSL